MANEFIARNGIISKDNSIISGSLNVTGGITGSTNFNTIVNKPTLVSGSSQITYSGLTGIPSGIVSGSSQITYSGISSIPSGIVSGSSQITYGGLTGIPAGIVSGSSQITLSSTTGYVANQHIDHSSVSISAGSGLVGGGNITTTRTLSIDTGSTHFLDGVKKELNTEGVISGSSQVTISNTTGYTTFSGSLKATDDSLSARIGVIEGGIAGTFATTGSNTFVGNQTIYGTLTQTSSAYIETIFERAGAARVTNTLQSTSANAFTTIRSFSSSYSPSARLQLQASSDASPLIRNSVLYSGDTRNYATTSDTTGSIVINSWYLQNDTPLGYIGYASVGNSDIYLRNATATGGIRFQTVGVERMYISSSGNVGIGTLSPLSKLHIEGNNSSTTDETLLTLRGAGENGKSIEFVNGNGNLARITGTKLGAGASANEGVIIFETATNTVFSEKVRILDTGNVGIGTTSPSGTVHIYSSDANTLFIERSGIGKFQVTPSSAYGGTPDLLFAANQASSGFWFRTNDASNNLINTLVLRPNGNVGIGTTNPASKLEVTGNIHSNVLNGFIQSGQNETGIVANIGTTQTYDVTSSNLSYKAYFGYDTYWDSVAGLWKGNRTTLGRKWVADAGYHTDSFRIRYYNGGSYTGWADSAFSDLFVVKGNGNVGIGTNNPTSLLHVVGNGTITGTLNVSGGITASLNGNATTATTLQTSRTINGVWFDGSSNINVNNLKGSNGYQVLTVLSNSLSTDGLNITAGRSSVSAPTDISTNYDLQLSSGTNKVTTPGNFGIGTTSPGALLDVNGDALINGNTIGNGGGNVSTNFAAGNLSLNSNTTGTGNIAVGNGALTANLTGNSNTVLGYYALQSNTGQSGTTAVGYYSQRYISSSAGNTANTSLGYQALMGSATPANNTGYQNTAIGYAALQNNTTGYQNAAVGYASLLANTTGNQNIGLGTQTLSSNTTGIANVAIGFGALYDNTTAGYNNAIGVSALTNNTLGQYNNAIGYQSMNNNTVGGYNVALGHGALLNNTSQNYSVAIGYYSQYYISASSTSAGNTSVGYQALQGSSTVASNTGTLNTAIGYASLFKNTSGYQNVGIGQAALYENTGGYLNTTIGVAALYGNTTGAGNIALGYQAGRYISDGTTANTTSANSIYIGRDTKAANASTSNEIVIGYGTTGLGSNSTIIGNDSTTKTIIKGNLGIGTTSPTIPIEVNGRIQGAGFNSSPIGAASTPANTAGWFKIGKIDSRGGGVLTLSFTGGSWQPVTYKAKFFKDYGAIGSLILEKYGTPNYITDVQIRQDSGDSLYYIEIYGASNTAGLNFNIYHDKFLGHDGATTIYTGALVTGSVTGTTIVSSSFTSATYGATFNSLSVDNYVGIGTNAPTNHLHIIDSSETRLGVQESTNNAWIQLAQQASNSYILAGRTGGTPTQPLLIYTGGTESMRIQADGKVGIGTSAPTTNLDVFDPNGVTFRSSSVANTTQSTRIMGGAYSGNRMTMMMNSTTATTNVLNIGGGTALAEPATSIQFYVGSRGTNATGTVEATMTSAGLAIGTANSPAYNLDVYSNARLYGAGGASILRLERSDPLNSVGVGAIGWATPNYITSITTHTDSTSTGSGYLAFRTGTQNSNAYLVPEKMRLTSNGNLLIGTTTETAGYELQVGGDILATGNLSVSGGITGSLNASSLTTGTIPDARLTGTYSGFTHKVDGSNTIFTTPNTGTQSANGRVVYGLAEYVNSNGAPVGAIVFTAPNTNQTVMHQLKIRGYLYNPANIIDLTVHGYITSNTWYYYIKENHGTIDVTVRWSRTPSGNSCLILGDTTTTWSYPHISITEALLSHSGLSDAYCYGWTVGLVTDLTGYTSTVTVPDKATVPLIISSTSGPGINLSMTPTTVTSSAIFASGFNTRGGNNYFDFLSVTNTTGSATNANKSFRLDVAGSLQIINSAYTTQIFELTDSGSMTIPGTINTKGVIHGVRNVTASTTLTSTDYAVIAKHASGNITITLPSASLNPGRMYIIKNLSGGSITVGGLSASNKLDTFTTYDISASPGGVHLISDGVDTWARIYY